MDLQTPSFTLHRASKEDLSFIVECAKQVSLKHRNETNLGKVGFLVSDYSAKQYSDFIDRANHFYIASIPGKEKVGFLLAYSDDLINKETEWTNSFLTYYLWRPFILVKQICVADTYASKGAAQMLYHELANRNPNIPLVAAIVSQPRNVRSETFHHKQGFRQILELLPDEAGGLPLTIWRNPNGYEGEVSRVKFTVTNEP